MEFDSFLWLHIASYISEYEDLISLSSTCQNIEIICAQLKEQYHEHHFDQIQFKMREIKNHIIALQELTDNASCGALCNLKPRFHQNMKHFKRKCESLSNRYSNACFEAWLVSSPHQALITCVDRHITIPDYNCIELSIQVKSWDYINFDIWPQYNDSFWFNHLEKHVPSTLEFAFHEFSKLTEINSDEEDSFVYCYFWFKKQPFPQNNTMIEILTAGGEISQYWVEDNKIHYCEQFAPRVGTLTCDINLWNNLMSHQMFIVNTLSDESASETDDEE